MHLQAQTFHLPVPEGIALEEAIKQLFDPSGEAVEDVKCEDCDETVTIRKLMAIIDPKVTRGCIRLHDVILFLPIILQHIRVK